MLSGVYQPEGLKPKFSSNACTRKQSDHVEFVIVVFQHYRAAPSQAFEAVENSDLSMPLLFAFQVYNLAHAQAIPEVASFTSGSELMLQFIRPIVVETFV
jgi:hypothetical protein